MKKLNSNDFHEIKQSQYNKHDININLWDLVGSTFYVDKNIKTIEENDTVGIIICKQDNKYVIKYCSDDRIIAREYELV